MPWRGFAATDARPSIASAALLCIFRTFRCHVGDRYREPRLFQAMRTALNRLLARPSILRALRSILAHEDLSFAALPRLHHRAIRPEASGRHQSSRSPTDALSSNTRGEHDSCPDNTSPSAAGTKADAKLPANPTKNPFDEWVQILHFQHRLYGNYGVRSIWKELRQGDVDLPTTGQWARPLWETFLTNDDIVEDVLVHATDLKSRTGLYYEPLYEIIIGKCFAERRHPDVYKWHVKLTPTFPPQEGALRRIASRIEGNRTSISAFRYIYARNDQRDVYDALITKLCDKHRWNGALQCHKVLARRGDLPSGIFKDSLWAGFLEELLRESGQKPTQEQSSNALQSQSTVHFSREGMNRVLGEVHGVKPKKMDDHFCARIFATKAFSIEVIIRGLGMFGVEEIGPVALREMASRTVDAGKICYNIKRLNEAGISVGQSVYTQALLKFAQDGRQDLIDSLLSTDQHPDALEDTKLQRKLLRSFIERGDWSEVHRTLAILTVFHRDPAREQWNILVQKLSTLRDVPKLCKVLEDMLSRGIPLTEASMSALQAYQLRHRRRGHRPVMQGPGYNDTTLIANIWRSTLASHGDVDPRRWAEIFRRFGMTERFNDVVKISLWLADWYSPENQSVRPKILKSTLQRRNLRSSILHSALKTIHPRHPLREVFSDAQIRAFVAWGVRRAFITPISDPHGNNRQPHFWAQGLRLCKVLRERGVHVNTRVVRAELRLQLVHLYGSGQSNRAYNRRSVTNNLYSVLQMIEYANEIWTEAAGKPLLDPKELVSGDTSHYGMWWLKKLRWDILQQLDIELSSRPLDESQRNQHGDSEAQEMDHEQPLDYGAGIGDDLFAEEDDTGDPHDASKS